MYIAAGAVRHAHGVIPIAVWLPAAWQARVVVVVEEVVAEGLLCVAVVVGKGAGDAP